jgi:hypothetical protein
VDPETFTRRPGATVSYEYREEGKPRVVLEIDEAKKRAAISAPLPVGATVGSARRESSVRAIGRRVGLAGGMPRTSVAIQRTHSRPRRGG